MALVVVPVGNVCVLQKKNASMCVCGLYMSVCFLPPVFQLKCRGVGEGWGRFTTDLFNISSGPQVTELR